MYLETAFAPDSYRGVRCLFFLTMQCFPILNDAIFLFDVFQFLTMQFFYDVLKKSKTSLKRCTLMMFLRRTVKWLKILFYWNIKFACLTKEFLKTSLKNSALFATQCNFHPTHVHMEPIIGSPCHSQTFLKPCEDCQCCQCLT